MVSFYNARCAFASLVSAEHLTNDLYHCRPYTANEVIVTGTFDNWARSLQLENKGRYWEKTVPLGNVKSGDKVLYKVLTSTLRLRTYQYQVA